MKKIFLSIAGAFIDSPCEICRVAVGPGDWLVGGSTGSLVALLAFELAFGAHKLFISSKTKTDLRLLFRFATSHQIDSFLKAHGVYEDCSVKEIENEVCRA